MVRIFFYPLYILFWPLINLVGPVNYSYSSFLVCITLFPPIFNLHYPLSCFPTHFAIICWGYLLILNNIFSLIRLCSEHLSIHTLYHMYPYYLNNCGNLLLLSPKFRVRVVFTHRLSFHFALCSLPIIFLCYPCFVTRVCCMGAITIFLI